MTPRARHLLPLVLALLVFTAPAHADSLPTASKPQSAVLVFALSAGSDSFATFGRDATGGGELGRALMAPFQTAGFTFASIAGLTPQLGDADPGLPLDDGPAMDLARQVKAQVAIVVGMVAEDGGRIRATPLVGQLVALRLRVLDVASGDVVFEQKVKRAGYGVDAAQALQLAGARAITEGMRGVQSVIVSRWTPRASDKASLSIDITGARGWLEVAAVFQRLAATKGVRAVHALEIGTSQVRLQVVSQLSVSSLVSSLRRARIQNGKLSVSASGNAISIRLMMNVPPTSGSPLRHPSG